VTDHVGMDGSSSIAVTADVHDLAGAQAMMASPSPADAAAMERHGVIPPLAVYVEKQFFRRRSGCRESLMALRRLARSSAGARPSRS